jgi:SAM-dependent methyltransferase
MDWADPEQRAIFFALHSGLPREGPGNRASTARALELAGALPPRPDVLDLGCGPGAQTIDLAELLPDATITALDAHPPFLEELERRSAARGLEGRIRTVRGDMADLRFEPGSFDLIWCEGAAYAIGLEAAFAGWRRLLREGGVLALTEPVWLTHDPPERAARLWEAYPAMRSADEVRGLAMRSGYRVKGDFVLPEEAWWTDYYKPMEERLAGLERSHAGGRAAAIVLGEAREEIECFRQHPHAYGYFFVVLEPA